MMIQMMILRKNPFSNIYLRFVSIFMKTIHVLCIGKLKEKALKDLEDQYLKRITQFQIHFHELAIQKQGKEKEGQLVLRKIQDLKLRSPYLILMAEYGKLNSSQSFAFWIKKTIMERQQDVVFLIGGPFGHGKEVIEQSQEAISLSPLTFPHQMARSLLVEQLYRAQTILQGHPYGH